MPYIKKEMREGIDYIIQPATDLIAKTKNQGVLNYIITKMFLATEPKRYKDYNALIGLLECCKLELYRRLIAEYEDKKKEAEGDVY